MNKKITLALITTSIVALVLVFAFEPIVGSHQALSFGWYTPGSGGYNFGSGNYYRGYGSPNAGGYWW
jgi:hypothetical protein